MDNPNDQHQGYLATVEIGGNQFTKVGIHQYKVISLTVVSSESVILELSGMEEPCVVVRDGSVSLDFIVRLLLQENLNVYGNNSSTNTNSDTTKKEGISIETTTSETDDRLTIMDLSPLMDDAHLLREKVLRQRQARFQFYLLDDHTKKNSFKTSSLPGYSASKTTTTTTTGNRVPNAGDWDAEHNNQDIGVFGGFFSKAMQASKWVGKQMIPRPDYWDPEEEETNQSIPFTNPLSWSSQINKNDKNNPFLPFIKMLSNDAGDLWYAVSMLEFRCGQCETQNPLHAMLAQELLKRISQKPIRENATEVIGRGIEYGTLTPEQSRYILKALHRTTPAICLTANAYGDLLKAVDHVLACFSQNSDQKKAIQHLMTIREEVQHAESCFFKRRNLKESSDPCCTAKKKKNNQKSKAKEKVYY